jgi:hypothetical protein
MNRVFAFASLMLSVGCQAKLTVSKNYTLPDDSDIAKILEMPPQTSEQTLKISVKVKSGDPIDVFVVKSSDAGNIIGTSAKEKKEWEQKGLGFQRDLKDSSFTVKIPPNTPYKVIAIQSDSAKAKSEFELKVTN